MKNYEKYADEIKKYDGFDFCRDFVKPYILESDNCNGLDCIRCSMLRAIWLMGEYEEPKEPEIDWSKVEVDTPILVAHFELGEWSKRYFAKYEDGRVYAWDNGRTSWNTSTMTFWKHAKLAEEEGE